MDESTPEALGAESHAGVVRDALTASDLTREALRRLQRCGLPDWVLGAGAVAQTVWNAAHSFRPDHGITDIDVVYYDPSDLSEAAERAADARVQPLLRDAGIRVDVKNQARVHEWYPSRFGASIRPYTSLEDALASWPSTATAVGVRQFGDHIEFVAPFGLGDLVNLVVRPNRVQVPPAVYRTKADRWAGAWPRLRVLPWSEGVGCPGERIVSAAPSLG